MAYRCFPDGNGATIRLWDDDGRLHHSHNPQFNALTQMASREDDVMVCGYPRSGNHWTWEIVHMLLTGKNELTEVDMKSHQLVHLQPADLDSLPSPRALDTHRQFQDLPTDFVIKKRKLVLVVRDPRDVCVSMYHFIVDTKARSEYQGTFGGFLSLFLQGKVYYNSWSGWVLSYEKGLKEHPEIPHHVVHYEKLKENPVKEIGRLAEFLGVDPSVAGTVAEQTNFSVMKKFKTKGDIPKIARIFNNGKANAHLFRKGQTGEWTEWFTDEQETHFINTLCEKLGRSSLHVLL